MASQGAVVVIEDDADVRNLLVAVLQQSGFDVSTASTGHEGVDLVREVGPDVVTLDVGLPDIDGHEVLRQIRAATDCYVIMLTARAEETDTLMALQIGADDYLTKPFRPRELRARVAALLRRPRAQRTAPRPDVAQSESTVPLSKRAILHHDGLVLDANARVVTLEGDMLTLTRSEFELLHDLMRSAGAVRTKAELVRVVRGGGQPTDSYVSDFDQRAIEVHIGNLRRKLEEDSKNPRWIMTVRGVGYRLTPVAEGE
ncbi:response regulator transcription factor [Micrococcaceae bacterium RIT802]|nr:response regulator transcription factor [Micrococcaceae bacterium RIT 802]